MEQNHWFFRTIVKQAWPSHLCSQSMTITLLSVFFTVLLISLTRSMFNCARKKLARWVSRFGIREKKEKGTIHWPRWPSHCDKVTFHSTLSRTIQTRSSCVITATSNAALTWRGKWDRNREIMLALFPHTKRGDLDPKTRPRSLSRVGRALFPARCFAMRISRGSKIHFRVASMEWRISWNDISGVSRCCCTCVWTVSKLQTHALFQIGVLMTVFRTLQFLAHATGVQSFQTLTTICRHDLFSGN